MRYTVYLCPKCNAQIGNRSNNNSMIIKSIEYGSPFERCWRCNKRITRNKVFEPALFISKKEKLPFLLTNKIVIYLFIFIYSYLVYILYSLVSSTNHPIIVFLLLLLLAGLVILAWVGLSALFYPRRNQIRDELIDESKKHIKSDINYCLSAIYLYLNEEEEELFKTLTPHETHTLHSFICKFLDEDKVPPFHSFFKALEKTKQSNVVKKED